MAGLSGGTAPALAWVGQVAGPEEQAAEPDAAGEEEVEEARAPYPLARFRASCLGRPCGAFQLLDLEASTDEETGASAGFRLQVAERAILGVTVDEAERSWSLTGSRLRLSYREGDAGRLAAAEWLGKRLSLRLTGRERLGLEGDGWLLDGGLRYRLDPELSFRVDVRSDLTDDPGPLFGPRPDWEVSTGVAWQRGRHLELEGHLSYGRIRDGIGDEVERLGARTRGVWQRPDLRLGLDLGVVETRGRFDRRQLEAGIDLAVRLGEHFLADGSAREAVELGVSETSRDWSLGVSLFGRRVRFPRGGLTGPSIVDLSELAWERGYGLDRVYEPRPLRALRERLRLSGDSRLERAATELYRAQVADENVPQIGLRWEATRRPGLGWRIDTGRAFVSLPWPTAAPWRRGEARRRFLRFEAAYTEARYGFGSPEIGRRYALVAELNRETIIRVALDEKARTPLELAQGKESVGGLRIDLVYAFRR